jgi:S1-C subfamily serine protease
MSFYNKKIPVLHFFTGLHGDYHRPSDDADKINYSGLARVAEMVADTAVAIAGLDAKPTYREVAASFSHGQARSGNNARPYFGSIPDYSQEQPGLALSGVTKGGPADKAGILAGDVIVKIGQTRVGNIDDFDAGLRMFKAGDKVPVIVKRDGKETTVTVTLGVPK